jgi:hypothetical protein
MDRNAIRRALENFNLTQEQMLRGMDRTIELLKQIRRDEQMEDVAQRTEEIARLQAAIAEELEKLGLRPEDVLPDMEPDEEGGQDTDPVGDEERNMTGDEASESDHDETSSEDKASNEDTESSESGESSDSDPSEDARSGEESSEDDSSAEQDTSREGEQSEGESSGEEGDSPEQETSGEEQNESSSGEESQEGQSSPENSESQQGQQGQQGQQQQGQQDSQEQEAKLEQLARDQQEAQAMLEELRRLLRTLQKLNEDQPDMANSMEELEKSQTAKDLQQNMQGAQQQMSGSEAQKAAPYVFRARDEANRLAKMARTMQSQMQQQQEGRNTEAVERIITGLIDVSRVEEEIARTPGDTRLLAQRQLNLTESAEALAESLDAVMKESFALGVQQQNALDKAIIKMGRATDLFEHGNQRKAEHQARESTSDLNETIVELMRSHQQMCGGSQGGGNASEQMQGLSQGQQQLNRSTRELLERLASQERLSMTDAQRMSQLAAQQEMIRKGLEELQENLDDTRELLGDLDRLAEDMKKVEEGLRQQEVDPRVKERQEQILSRLLDAQRSIRQQEMSPQRQSKTGTLAARPSPPPIPEDLLRRDRTLEEDVLRGANDRYPSQYRKLVEEYFRALSRESRTP